MMPKTLKDLIISLPVCNETTSNSQANHLFQAISNLLQAFNNLLPYKRLTALHRLTVYQLQPVSITGLQSLPFNHRPSIKPSSILATVGYLPYAARESLELITLNL